MKSIKNIISIVLAFALCFGLCACVSENSVTGIWTDSYIYNGSSFDVTLILEEDGSYSYLSYKDGAVSRAMEGIWETTGGEVCLYTETGSIDYKYTGGALVNGSQELTKN